MGAAEARLTMLASRAESPLNRAAVAGLQIELYTGLDQNDRAVDVCLVCLHRLGIELSPHPAEEEAPENTNGWNRCTSAARSRKSSICL
jgi:hypothetical protein